MTVAKVAVSLERDLLARVDEAAAATGQSRSGFVRLSLSSALDALEEKSAVREARAIYGEVESHPALRRLHAAFGVLARETLPPYAAAESEPAADPAGPPQKARR